MKKLCIKCSTQMKKTHINHRGLSFEGSKCPKCSQKVFTEEQTMKAINKLESAKIANLYIKHPIRIGNSRGITFPKDVAEAFNINKSSTKLRIHPDISKGIIEIKTQ